jgi:hypothetical protein
MSSDPNDVVQVFRGPLIDVETYQLVLKEAGIESKIVGTELTGGLGSAIPDSIELWIHRGDSEKAAAAIKLHEESKGRHGPAQHHGHPKSDHKPPHPTHHRPEPHIKQDPLGE